MNHAWRPRHDVAPTPSRLDDLRLQLPAQLRQVPDEQVADLWLGWSAARHGHGAAFLVKQFGLPLDVAETLLRLNASEGS